MSVDLVMEVALYGYPVGWFAPAYRDLSQAWLDIVKKAKPYATNVNNSEYRIQLFNGGMIEAWSLKGGDAGRSRRYARVVIDEAAKAEGLMRTWNDAVRPTLTDFQGDAWFLSTPKGRNDFFGLYQRGLDDYYHDWACWQMPTSTNPFIAPSEIEAAKADLPERSFAQEYLAEFLEDSAVFRRIRESATANRQDGAKGGHSYVIGCDWGKYEDFSVFTVIDETLGEVCHIDRSNMIDYTVQVKRLRALCDRFNPRTVIAESNANETTIELLRQEEIPVEEFRTTSTSKQNAIEKLMLGLEKGDLKILDNELLLGELQAFEATRLPSGAIRYAAPAGYHDDMVMSLALAYSTVGSSGPLIVTKRKSVSWR
jgi:hypothetical protein